MATPFTCEQCQCKFRSSGDLKRHKCGSRGRQKENTEPTTVRCQMCWSVFRRQEYMKRRWAGLRGWDVWHSGRRLWQIYALFEGRILRAVLEAAKRGYGWMKNMKKNACSLRLVWNWGQGGGRTVMEELQQCYMQTCTEGRWNINGVAQVWFDDW